MGSQTADSPSVDAPTELLRTLPRAAYVDDRHYSREVDRIWLREWVCVGREESLPAAGDYLKVEVAEESILLVRGRDGKLRAFDNVCRHRGSQLVFDAPPPGQVDNGPHGRFKGAIRCPYHAWTYGLDGQLRNAPFLTESDGLRREQLGLYPVGIDTWGGFMFMNLTPEELTRERELPACLGETAQRTANYPLADLQTGHRITYEVDANWKAILENYNECYHCGPVHPELCEVVPAFKEGGAGLDWDAGVPHREGATTFTFSGTTDRAPFPGLTEDEQRRHKGELVYPNLMISLAADHVAAFTLWPAGPGHTRIQCDFLFHPDEMARPTFDPSDAVEFWDIVNRQDWRICESVQRGMGSRRFTAGYYAPMEDPARDIRRYLAEALGDG